MSQLVTLAFVICAMALSLSLIVSSVKLEQSMSDSNSKQLVPIGSLGPLHTNRKHYRYYDSMYYTALQYGADAHSVLEVGCASDPFIKYLDWADRRTCVAPYFVDYANNNKTRKQEEVEKITADFMEYNLPNNQKYDLLLCNQVLEHVSNPQSFMRKLIDSAETSIISVPYDWGACGAKNDKKGCNHITDNIDYDRLLMWTAPHKPIHSAIVTEKMNSKFNRRIILVYKPSETIELMATSPVKKILDGVKSGDLVREHAKGGIHTLIEDEMAIAAKKRQAVTASKKKATLFSKNMT